jgi:hypothetical protein
MPEPASVTKLRLARGFVVEVHPTVDRQTGRKLQVSAVRHLDLLPIQLQCLAGPAFGKVRRSGRTVHFARGVAQVAVKGKMSNKEVVGLGARGQCADRQKCRSNAHVFHDEAPWGGMDRRNRIVLR